MKNKISESDYWAMLALADSVGVTSRLTRKPKEQLIKENKKIRIKASEVSEAFVMQKLRKRNRFCSSQNIKDRMYRNDTLRDKARAKRRAFLF